MTDYTPIDWEAIIRANDRAWADYWRRKDRRARRADRKRRRGF